MKTEEAVARFWSNLPTLRRHRRVPARRSRLQSSARSALNGRVSHCLVEKINYPGIGNDSQFVYDGFGKTGEILEYSASSLTITRRFSWC